jgi:hypothetical protein
MTNTKKIVGGTRRRSKPKNLAEFAIEGLDRVFPYEYPHELITKGIPDAAKKYIYTREVVGRGIGKAVKKGRQASKGYQYMGQYKPDLSVNKPGKYGVDY